MVIASVIILGVAALFIYAFFFSKGSAFSYVFTPNKTREAEDGRITVLLLGMAGGKHDGATLTDSIIVASYNIKTDKALLISIPRDLWISSESAKVNAVYQKGEKEGKGLSYVKEKIHEVVGLPVDYAVRLDFSGFAKAIDLVGGIDVDVPKTFDDYNYPIEGKETDLCGNKEEEIDLTEEQAKVLKVEKGKKKVIVTLTGKIATESADFACRFEHISFEKGVTRMDGETALKFVRSRMGTNNEGSDFARSKRQQLVLEAFKAKALSAETLINPQKIGGLIQTFGDSIETDIGVDKYLQFYNFAKKVKQTDSIVLGDLGDGKSILIVPPASEYGGGFVLIPPNNNFGLIKDLIQQKITEQDLGLTASPTPTPSASPKK